LKSLENYRKKAIKVLTFLKLLGILITVAAIQALKAYVSGGLKKG
jgi:hypothetical protein